MTVHDNYGRRRLAAFDRARREFRDLAFAASHAADDAVLAVMIREGKVCVHYYPGTDHDAVDRNHLLTSTADAIAAVRRAKRGLLDTLAYIDGIDITAPAPRQWTHMDGQSLDHRRAVFLSDALEADKALRGGTFAPDIFAKALNAADELAGALQTAREER